MYTQETQHIFRPDYHQILSTFPILGEVFFPTPKTKVTALHRAAQFGLLDVAQILLDANAEVDVTSEEGFTPLMLAARTGQSYSAWKTKTKMTMGISPFLNKRYIFKLLCFYCHFFFWLPLFHLSNDLVTADARVFCEDATFFLTKQKT